MKYSQDFYDGKYTIDIYTNFKLIKNIEITHNISKCNMKSYIFDLRVTVDGDIIIHSEPHLGCDAREAYKVVNVVQEALAIANTENLTLDMLVSLGYSKAAE